MQTKKCVPVSVRPIPGIQIVLARFIDHANHPGFLRNEIRPNLIDLPQFEYSRRTLVPNAHNVAVISRF